MDNAVELFYRLTALSQRPPTTEEQLHAWIYAVLGFHIPRISPTVGMQAPFDFVSDSYFGRVTRSLVLAARGTGKTRLLSIGTLLRSQFKPGCTTAYYSAVSAQGDWGFGYLRDMMSPRFLKQATIKDTNSYLKWRNGSWCRSGSGYSLTGITAFRCNRLVVDEVDLWPPENFETASYMVTGTHTHKPERQMASTVYTSYGMMSTLLDQAKRRRMKVYKWDIFTAMERCPECRGKKCPLWAWENPRSGKYEQLCRKRGLRADGFLPYEVVIDEYLSTDSETYLVQKLLGAPERRSLIYPQYDDNTHAKKTPKKWMQHAKVGIGVDWGYDHPLVFTVFAEKPNGRLHGIEEVGERFATPDRELELARALADKYGPDTPFYCGKDQPKSIAAYAEAGLIVIPNVVTLRDSGHRLVRRLLDPNKGPLLHLDPKAMPMTIHQLATIHRDDKGREVLKDNDFADSARHVLASSQELGGMHAGGGIVY